MCEYYTNAIELSRCLHGTFVAGILSGRRGSVAPAICPGCTLLVRPIFAETTDLPLEMPSASPDELAVAITDCVADGANVVNLSLALAHPSPNAERALQAALDEAMRRGVMIVAAAGNQGTVGSSAITRHPWVIPVVANDPGGRPLSHCNLSRSIGRNGLCAPGDRITSLGAAGEPLTFGGTSAAAPFVTGAAALLWSEFPAVSAAQVKHALVIGSRTPRKTGCAGDGALTHCRHDRREAAMADQRGFFDLDERYRALSAAGDPLERLATVVDFAVFRADLETALARSDRAKGGRPPYDAVLMFKVLVLQVLYGLSDDQAEFQILDRRSFGRFLGLDDGDTVPDAKTIWLFRETLTRAGAVERLFNRFDRVLNDRGYLAMGGQIVDATVIEARRPRLSAKEKATIKGGGVPAHWSKAKRAQMDRDGRWTLKRGKRKPAPDGSARAATEIVVPAFGYKNHIGIDRRFGLIRTFSVTNAAAHDGGQLAALIDPDNLASGVWADTAYRSAANLALLDRRGLLPQFQRAKPRGKPMPAHIARGNASRGRIRARVEHVFALQKRRLGLIIRSVGLARARTGITLANLAYNMRRLAWLEGQAAPA